MPLQPGTRLGPYEIVSLLGVGGMGEVYRATDTHLKRGVAIKVLPAAVAGDAERLTRFQREAEVLAALNHPNIAHIHGLEKTAGVTALVMELVEGPTLADRIATGPISLDDALLIARQIADALEAAHEQGIVHRDLKPANIKLREDGTVKVLDFGLAKTMEPAAAMSASALMSPTITSPAMTQRGVILGTAAYMSPEQARGKPVDKRSDIWAFGVVLLEMFTGKAVFAGETVTDVLAAVVTREPDLGVLPAATPPRVRELLRRCLQKDSKQRLRDVGDARIALQEAQDELGAPPTRPDTPAASRRRERVFGVVALLSVLTTIGVLLRSVFAPAPVLDTVRLDVLPLGSTSAVPVRWLDLSPDGRHLMFSTVVPTRGIYVRSLDSPSVRLVPGTELASGPPPIFFWSADSRYIAYFAEGRLKKVPAAGGPAEVICTLPPALNYTGTWSERGVILFGAATREGTTLWRVPAAGGQPVPLHDANASKPEQAFFPIFLPDGRHYLAMAPTGNGQTAEAFVGELDSTDRRRLPGVTSSPRYSSAGYLLFARAGSLVAQPFDLGDLELSGEPRLIVENLGDSVGGFSASATGALAYRAARTLRDSPLVSFDRTGTQLRSESLSGSLQAPSLSRDGKRVAIERTDSSNTDVWVIDLVRGTNTRLTDDPEPDIRPVFSADGTRVAFSRGNAIFLKASSGTGTEERLMEGEVTDWSPDGKFISFIGEGDLWTAPVDGDRTPTRLVQTKGNDRRGRFSPDGRWIAYESDFSGRFEVYVQRFPPTPERVQVSANGGSSAYWRSDGKELYFSESDQTIMAVDVTLGASFHAGTPRKMFDVPGGVINNRRFVVTPDGQQFLLPVQKAEASPITVVLNWATELRK